MERSGPSGQLTSDDDFLDVIEIEDITNVLGMLGLNDDTFDEGLVTDGQSDSDEDDNIIPSLQILGKELPVKFTPDATMMVELHALLNKNYVRATLMKMII